MVELREETGVQRSLSERLVRSRLQWTGHVERMADDSTCMEEEDKRQRGWKRLSDEAVKKLLAAPHP